MNRDEFSPEPIHSVLVFYGIKDDDARCERFFYSSVQWMGRMGGEPNRVGYLNPDAPDKNLHDFNEWLTQNRNLNFASVSAFELHRFQPTGNSGWADPLLSADFSRYEFSGIYAYRLARSTVTRLGLPAFDDADKEMLDILEPEYGIGYTMPVAFGPSSYAIGIYVGRPDAYTEEGGELALRINHWGVSGMANHVYRRGLLRGVYPRNYLAQVQLAQRVGEVALSEWIVQEPSRGTLVELGCRLKLWIVPEDNTDSIEKKLWDAGIIFDWRRHASF